MRRPGFWPAAGLALLLAAPAMAEAGGALGGGAGLRDWAGKYPTDRQGGHVRRFLDEPVLRAGQGWLSAAQLRKLRAYQVESPIEADGDYLLAHVCKPHDCGAHGADIVVDWRDGAVWFGFTDAGEAGPASVWVGARSPLEIPASVAARVRGADGP